MKQSANFSEFCDGFRDMGRNEQFTYEGKRALFDYLEDYEESTGEEIELDVIALCCEYTEYASLKDLQEDYTDIESMEDLEDKTTVIMIDGEESFIILAY